MFIIVCILMGGCFEPPFAGAPIYTDLDTGLQSQSWFYSPEKTTEETKKKLVNLIRNSSLYKVCVERNDIPKATYSESIFSSLTLTCLPKNKPQIFKTNYTETLQNDLTVYTDPETGFESQSWFYFSSRTTEETERKLIIRIHKSSLYKACIERGDTPKATYSDSIFGSLILTCLPKNKPQTLKTNYTETLQNDLTVYTDPETEFESQSWFYFSSRTTEETERKLIMCIYKSSLYKDCIKRGDTPKATYSDSIFGSLTLICLPKKKTMLEN